MSDVIILLEVSETSEARKLLIVDDAWVNRMMLREIFKDSFTILEAENGREALDIIRRESVSLSLVILDILMPVMDGYEVLDIIKSSHELASIPVIIVTSSDDESNELKALELGAADFVRKPINATIIRSRVFNIVSKHELERVKLENAKLFEQQQTLMLQKEQAELISMITSSVNAGLAVCENDPALTYSYIHPNLCTLLGYTQNEYARLTGGSAVSSIFPPDRTQALDKRADMLSTGDFYRVEYRMKRKDGTLIWVQDSGRRFLDGKTGRIMYNSLITDITQLKTAMETLRYKSEYDELTGIFNFSAFCSHASELITSDADHGYCILSFDVERFKLINDIFGYVVGDKLLKVMVEAARRVFPDGSVIGRQSGDRFLACIPADGVNYEALVHDYNELINTKFKINFNISVFFGIYVIADINVPVNLMCDRARLAIRTIKGNYIRRFAFFENSQRDSIIQEQRVINEMSNALLTNQFQQYFQPQFDYNTGKIVGAETLARWIHPKLGLILPNDFIPIFEKNGFIMRLDEYMWEQACRWISERKKKKNVTVPIISANISRSAVYYTKLHETITAITEKHLVSNSMFRLEITESAYIDDPLLMIDTVKKLRDHGFVIEMDDFGSGYSSLNILKDVPVDVLKLDMRFLSNESNIETDRGREILRSVVEMGKRLGTPVIAEGVETKNQADFLHSIGCDIHQGYYYAKPMPAEHFEQMLDNHRRS